MTQIPDIAWCEVPAGEFIMGSDDSGRSNEKPQHTLNLPYTYYAAKYPVTNAQYATFVADGGYDKPQYWTAAGWAEKEQPQRQFWQYDNAPLLPWTGPRDFGEPFNLLNHPVVGVSWYEAVAFCHWLTEKLRADSKLADGWLIRLPTQAEWEKAARGTDGRVYPWGNEFDPNKANCKETDIKSTSAVGFFPKGKSPYGCQDMAGNVWEWCATKYDKDYKPYPCQIENEGTEACLEEENYRILRGGSWGDEANNLRCAYRNFNIPYDHYDDRGFRVFRVSIC